METKVQARPVNFKFGEYISQGIDLMKKDFGTIFLSLIFTVILGIIPFLGFMAAGNFYKICRKIDMNIPVEASEIFNFDDFMPYFIFQIYIIIGFILVFVPFALLGIFADGDGVVSGFAQVIGFIYLFAAYFAAIYFLLQSFYMPALFTFKKITDIKTAWNISKVMTKGNLWTILFFSIAVTFLAELGIILCGIGIFLTIPFLYTSHYFAFKDGLSQIEHDELQEIGQNY